MFQIDFGQFFVRPHQAWDVILKETETLMKTVRQRCDHMSTHTLDVLGQLIAEKKGARKKYVEERSRLDNDFAKVCY